MKQTTIEMPSLWVLKDVEVDRIVLDDDEAMSEGLYRNLLKSVLFAGIVFQSVVLTEIEGTDLYRVIAGKRRVLSARKAELEKIPAMVLPSGSPDGLLSIFVLLENMNRSPNPAAEAESIDEVMSAYGWTEAELSRNLGVPLSRIKSRIRLFDLIPELFERLRKGDMTLTLAEKMRALPTAKQRELIERGSLTINTAEEALRRNKLDLLPAELFHLPEEVPFEDEEELIEQIKKKLEQVIAISTNGKKGRLQQALAILREV